MPAGRARDFTQGVVDGPKEESIARCGGIATAIRWADQKKEGKGRRLGRARVLFVQVVLLKTALEACRLSSSEASKCSGGLLPFCLAIFITYTLNSEP
ncbi:hypothetical protein EJB05_09776, partial [Eragrostis curvula]